MVTQTEDTIALNLERKVNDSYHIVVGADLFPRIARELRVEMPHISRFAIITDSNVGLLYAAKLQDQFIEHAQCRVFTFPAGEQNKTMQTVTNVLEQLGEARYNRDTVILALGGGVVGDLVGCVAGLINRGVPYVQIPTTTLAQADSAVGGKTGVDLKAGKNLAGLFKQPWRVYMDVNTLRTLDDRNYRAGLVEVIKHGVIQDAEFFDYLEQHVDALLARDKEVLKYLARVNSRIKGNVVEIDPNEKGLRRILNYGHTLGHAIETASDYELLHGEAVALGMMAAGWIAYSTCGFPLDDLREQNNLLRRLGIPDKMPRSVSNDDIIRITLSDKKAAGGKARYCLPIRIGEMHPFGEADVTPKPYVTPVDVKVVREALDSIR
jgi:3-dehydroquinate synthase